MQELFKSLSCFNLFNGYLLPDYRDAKMLTTYVCQGEPWEIDLIISSSKEVVIKFVLHKHQNGCLLKVGNVITYFRLKFLCAV